MIWDVEPDFTVSIGTGFAQPPESPVIHQTTLGLGNRFILRLIRSWAESQCGQNHWNDHQNRLPEETRGKYFRINMPLDKEPDLDEVEKMPELRQLASSFLSTYDFLSITRAIFSASFFFELDQVPRYRDQYICTGSIRCRSPDRRALIARILQEYPAAAFTTDQHVSLGYINERNLCMSCGLYRKAVSFSVYHPSQVVRIYLRFNRLHKQVISGFPQTVSWFVERQKLHAQFGRSDHHNPNYSILGKCDCNIRSNRKRSLSSKEKRASKRVCLAAKTRNDSRPPIPPESHHLPGSS